MKGALLILALTTGNAFATPPPPPPRPSLNQPYGILGLNKYPTGLEVHLQTGGNSKAPSHKSLPSGEGKLLVTGFAKIGDEPFVTLYDPKSKERLAISQHPNTKGDKILTLTNQGPALSEVSGTAWISNKEVPFGGVHISEEDTLNPIITKMVLLSDFSQFSARKQGFAKGFDSLWHALTLITAHSNLWKKGNQYEFLLQNPLPPECSFEELKAALQGRLERGADQTAPKLHLMEPNYRKDPLISPTKALADLLYFDQETLKQKGHPTSQRDWEKYPPITDSEVGRYEIEHNIPLEERFDYLEKKDMSDWQEDSGHTSPFLTLNPNSFSLEYQNKKGMVSVNSEQAFYEGYTRGWRAGVQQYLAESQTVEPNSPEDKKHISGTLLEDTRMETGKPFDDTQKHKNLK